MGDNEKQNLIIAKLEAGVKFGMYEGGRSCYFDDGTKIDYQDLWDVLRTMHNLGNSHNKTLYELCPDTYMGVFSHKFNKNTWAKKILSFIPGMHNTSSSKV